jgi:ribosome-associated heat shock protein Hsp15
LSQNPERIRLDKWLWAARFYKTRSLAAEEIGRNRVQVNEQAAKPAREVKVGDKIQLRQGAGLNLTQTTVIVKILSPVRGPAPVARTLYEETPESIQAREAHREKRRIMNEPATSIEDGRPTKRDRRKLSQWERWSASLDDLGMDVEKA